MDQPSGSSIGAAHQVDQQQPEFGKEQQPSDFGQDPNQTIFKSQEK